MVRDKKSSAEITVVIPMYNRAGLIARCLDSVLAQTHRPLRVIVVDNNSTDDSVGAVRRWIAEKGLEDSSNLFKGSKHKTDAGFQIDLYSEMKPGAAAARNRGLREVSSEWVFFADSDDTIHPDLIQRGLKAGRNKDLVEWRRRALMPNGKWRRYPFSRIRPIRSQILRCILCTMSFMVRTDFIRSAGGWNENARVWDDWELGIRLLLKHPRMGFIDTAMVDIYPQDISLTGTDFHSKAGTWESTIDLAESIAGAPRRHFVYVRTILAANYRREGCTELGDALLLETLSNSDLPAWRRILLRLIYRYTAAGGRAAYMLWP